MEQPVSKDTLTGILQKKEHLKNSELSRFSDLDDDELVSFRLAWDETSSERRREVICQMVRLCQANFKLDFNAVFAFLLHDPDPEVRTQAINGLAEEEDQHHIFALSKIVRRDDSREARAAATAALGRFAILAELPFLSLSHV